MFYMQVNQIPGVLLIIYKWTLHYICKYELCFVNVVSNTYKWYSTVGVYIGIAHATQAYVWWLLGAQCRLPGIWSHSVWLTAAYCAHINIPPVCAAVRTLVLHTLWYAPPTVHTTQLFTTPIPYKSYPFCSANGGGCFVWWLPLAAWVASQRHKQTKHQWNSHRVYYQSMVRQKNTAEDN